MGKVEAVMVTRNVVVKTQFSAVHCWPACPFEEVLFLQHPHRHIFHLTLKFPVTHTDRDIEFIRMKNEIHSYIQDRWEGKDIGSKSCETIADEFASIFAANYVSVFEDDENGVEVFYDRL